MLNKLQTKSLYITLGKFYSHLTFFFIQPTIFFIFMFMTKLPSFVMAMLSPQITTYNYILETLIPLLLNTTHHTLQYNLSSSSSLLPNNKPIPPIPLFSGNPLPTSKTCQEAKPKLIQYSTHCSNLFGFTVPKNRSVFWVLKPEYVFVIIRILKSRKY